MFYASKYQIISLIIMIAVLSAITVGIVMLIKKLLNKK